MTSSNEVIALEGAGSDPLIFKTNFKPKKHLTHRPYFMDPSIVPRVKQYLEDNKDQVYVDIDDMVTALQRKYREYGKKKRPAFKGIVEKAFSVVLKNYSLNDDELQNVVGSGSSSISDMDIDSEDDDLIVETNNTSNNQVLNMYMQHQAMKKLNNSNNDGAKELIDISSDEEDQVPAKRLKHVDSTNGNIAKALPVAHPSNSQAQSQAQPQPQPQPQPPKAANGQATRKEVAVAEEQTTVSGVTASAPPAQVASSTPERPKRKRPTADGGSGAVSASVSSDASRKRREVAVVHPCCSFKDIGGSSKVLQEVCKLLVHLRHPEIFEQIGVSPPRGFLLHGPPGCGKSLLANAIAGELGLPLLKVAAPELVAGVSGESEERIRDLFDQAVSIAPCILFIDEIDAITPNRNNAQREMERRIVAQLLTTLDELGEKEGGNQVLVVGATNRPDSLDPALRRAGRFDREVCMGIPDREARAHILRVVCGRLALAPDVSSDAGIDELAALTPGFVGADLSALTREAAMVAVNRVFAQLESKKTEAESELKLDINREAEQPASVPSQKVEVDSPKVVEVSAGDAQPAMNTTEESATSIAAESEPEVAAVESEVVNLEEGENETATASQEAVEEGKGEAGELEGDLSASLEEQEVGIQAELEVEESEGNEASSTDVQPSSSAENAEVTPQETDNTEPALTVNAKTDEEIEVLELELANSSDASSQPSLIQPNEILSTSDQPTTDKVEQKEMSLSQKLQPVSIWSPQLCLLMSWLKDTPPLTAAQLSDLSITMADFHEALHEVQPSSKREGFATVPDVTWEDVGSLATVRAELQLCVLAPVRYAKQFSQLGLSAPAGVLLCGPPGCGKTLLAKAVANEAGINFISVKGPELLNMYVGESERAVRQVFQRARNSAPCVIFFDELDALCPKRSDSGDNGVSSRVVNQLLTEMDGVEGRSAVYLMAASNRPDIIDPAVLRPGRLDKIVYVGLPNAEDRKDILRALTKNGSRPQLSSDVDLPEIASRPQLEGYSGADLAALVREAGVQALKEFIGNGGDPLTAPLCVAARHFNSAAAKIRPSVTIKDRKHYEKLKEMYSSGDEKPEAMDTA